MVALNKNRHPSILPYEVAKTFQKAWTIEKISNHYQYKICKNHILRSGIFTAGGQDPITAAIR